MQPGRRLVGFLVWILGLTMLLISIVLIRVLALRRPRARQPGSRPSALITGQFASPNWLAAHLLPLARSHAFSSVWVVSTDENLTGANVHWIIPSPRMRSVLGDTGARLLTFAISAIRYRPDWIIGFHLLFNGLLAILLAKLIRSHSAYFCVGGPAEVFDGGIDSENKLFGRLRRPSKTIQSVLLKVSQCADAIIFMGQGARKFYIQNGYKGIALVNPGGIEQQPAHNTAFTDRNIDILFVGRLSLIKDLPLFIDSIALIRLRHDNVSAVIVGDGGERDYLETYVQQKNLEGNIRFAGYQQHVIEWLNRAKVLVLTSKSEGLSLAVMEALASGLPVVAPNVGDLKDAIRDGVNGYLIESRDPAEFAEAISSIAFSEYNFARSSRAATKVAEDFHLDASKAKWIEFVEQIELRGTV